MATYAPKLKCQPCLLATCLPWQMPQAIGWRASRWWGQHCQQLQLPRGLTWGARAIASASYINCNGCSRDSIGLGGGNSQKFLTAACFELEEHF